MGDPGEARVAAEDAAVQSQRDTADVLRILKVVRAIRNRGHLSARLDPLGRALGPLIEGYETMETSVPDGGADIARLLSGYPDGLFLRGRKVNAGQYLGLHDARPEREFYFGDELTTLDATRKNRAWWSLDDVLLRLRAAYCGTLSAEFDHLDSAAKKRWMRGRLEGHARDFFDGDGERVSENATLRSLTPTRSTSGSVWQSGGPVAGSSKLEEGLWLDADEKRAILRRLLRAERLELFLGKHFPSAKRFGLEGAEALIPGLQSLVETAAERGVEQIVVGMAHRGRLNILHSVFAKPLAAICAEMRSEGASDFNVGDVRYHLGARAEVRVPFAEDELGGLRELGYAQDSKDSKTVEMTMAPNPSHLEAVNAVAAGMVRSKQARVDPSAGRFAPRSGLAFRPGGSHGSYLSTTSVSSRRKVAGLLLHGDAAFCGLGANAETMQLQDLPEYATGGTMHVVVNNQIGFTTVPRRARSSPHPSDVAKGYGAPIFHVNGDDPEAVVRACRLAAEYRAAWGSDVVVNLVCYRRLGHNEQDDPSITLPLRAAAIDAQPRVAETYAERLVRTNVCSRAEIEAWTREIEAGFDEELRRSSEYVENPEDWAVSAWRRPTAQRECDVVEPPGVQLDGGTSSGNAADAEHAPFIVEDGPAGPQSRPRNKPTLTTTPNHGVIAGAALSSSTPGSTPGSWARAFRSSNPRAVTTGVPLPLLRALGMAVTELPEEKTTDDSYAEKNFRNDDDDDHDDDDDDDAPREPSLERAALEARLIADPKKTLFPPDFVPHPHVRRLLAARRAMVTAPEPGVGSPAAAGAHPRSSLAKTPGVDWGAAELLAFGTLVLQTDDEQPHCHVRLSGQDVERGTFNHRHAVLYCSRTSRGVNPLDNLGLGRQDRFVAANSPLSEHAVLGFEYGYSVDAGHETLVLWEAQFGDFSNNAQSIIDQFITTAEAKWGQRSGLVLLLPHGHDGQGPDHSSARPERWLAAANDDPDSTPGRAPRDVELARRTFHALLAGSGDDETNDVTNDETNDETNVSSAVSSVSSKEVSRETSDSKKPKRSRFLSLERLSARVAALEREAAAADAGASTRAASFDDLALFDEEGALLSEETDAMANSNDATDEDDEDDEDDASEDDASSQKRQSRQSETKTTLGNSGIASPRDARLAARATRRKARAAREMLDDVFSFFGREVGTVDERAWARYMRHRARAHADASANFVVVSPSTPAQYFHALRRQALAPHRKPMVVLAPKYLLHHRPCASPLGDFGPKTRFRAVVADGDRGDNLRKIHHPAVRTHEDKTNGHERTNDRDPSRSREDREDTNTSFQDTRRVIMCTGKVFYSLHRARKARGLERKVALVRLEQLFPFPHEALARRLARYPTSAELVWAQEEPKNMGFWAFTQPRVATAARELVARHSGSVGFGDDDETAKPERRIRYVGRPASASPASGSPTIHARENKALVDEALGGL